MEPLPISGDLRILYVALRRQACLGEPMEPALCRRLALVLARLARKADDLEAQALTVPELEDELLAVATDLDRAVPASIEPGYEAALREQQREIQRRLDGGGPVHVSRPGLAALSMPIGDTNVVVMPIAPRPRPFGGGTP